MDNAVFIVAWFLLLLFWPYASLRRHKRAEMHKWRAVAETCGLTDLEESGGLRGVYRLEDGSELGVRFEAFRHEDPNDPDDTLTGTRLSVDSGGGIVPISLSRQLRSHELKEIQVGEESFDDDFIVGGPVASVRAVLDADTRRLLSALLIGADLNVRNGRLTVGVRATSRKGADPGELARTVSLLLDAAGGLQKPRGLVARLADNARRDPAPGVRLANLLTLVADFPEHPATEPLLVAACNDESETVRVRAAIALGERGRGMLQSIAALTLDDDAGARAVAALGTHLPIAAVKDVLGRALRLRLGETARASLETLGRHGGKETFGLALKVMSIEKGDLAVAALEALAATGFGAAEATLVSTLDGDAPDLRTAAARALGRLGSAASVLPLKEAEARHRREAGFGRAARQAIAEIQSRLGGATPGQLSLTSAEAGTLSLVDDERGRLSVKASDER